MLESRDDTSGLLELLEHDDVRASAKLRRSIMIGLYRCPDPRATAVAMRLAQEDTDKKVRRRAMAVLHAIGDRSSVKFFADTLTYSGDRVARMHAVGGLTKTRANEAVRPLIAALKDKSGMIRIAAANGLADIGDRSARSPIEAALRQTWNPFLRKGFKMALDRLR